MLNKTVTWAVDTAQLAHVCVAKAWSWIRTSALPQGNQIVPTPAVALP